MSLAYFLVKVKTMTNIKTVYMCTVSGGKESACKEVQSVCHEDPLEKGLAAHSSIRGWRIP